MAQVLPFLFDVVVLMLNVNKLLLLLSLVLNEKQEHQEREHSTMLYIRFIVKLFFRVGLGVYTTIMAKFRPTCTSSYYLVLYLTDRQTQTTDDPVHHRSGNLQFAAGRCDKMSNEDYEVPRAQACMHARTVTAAVSTIITGRVIPFNIGPVGENPFAIQHEGVVPTRT